MVNTYRVSINHTHPKSHIHRITAVIGRQLHCREEIDLMEATEELRKQVEEQGNVVRGLKANKAPKEEISAALNQLFSLKTQLKEAEQLEMGNLLEEIAKLKNANGDEAVIKEKEARVEQLQKYLENHESEKKPKEKKVHSFEFCKN